MDLILKNRDVPMRAPARAVESHDGFPPPLELSDDVLRFRNKENAVAASAAVEATEPMVRTCSLMCEISSFTLCNSLTSSARLTSLSASNSFFRVCNGLKEVSFRNIRGPFPIVRACRTAVPNPASYCPASDRRSLPRRYKGWPK